MSAEARRRAWSVRPTADVTTGQPDLHQATFARCELLKHTASVSVKQRRGLIVRTHRYHQDRRETILAAIEGLVGDQKISAGMLRSCNNLIWNDPLSNPSSFRTVRAVPPSECLAVITAPPHEPSAGSRGAAGAARRARSPGRRAWLVRSPMRRCSGREDDGRSRALRRRVTLIFGGYHDRSWQSTHDSASSGGRAV